MTPKFGTTVLPVSFGSASGLLFIVCGGLRHGMLLLCSNQQRLTAGSGEQPVHPISGPAEAGPKISRLECIADHIGRRSDRLSLTRGGPSVIRVRCTLN